MHWVSVNHDNSTNAKAIRIACCVGETRLVDQEPSAPRKCDQDEPSRIHGVIFNWAKNKSLFSLGNAVQDGIVNTDGVMQDGIMTHPSPNYDAASHPPTSGAAQEPPSRKRKSHNVSSNKEDFNDEPLSFDYMTYLSDVTRLHLKTMFGTVFALKLPEEKDGEDQVRTFNDCDYSIDSRIKYYTQLGKVLKLLESEPMMVKCTDLRTHVYHHVQHEIQRIKNRSKC